jgi:hypothetical protein
VELHPWFVNVGPPSSASPRPLRPILALPARKFSLVPRLLRKSPPGKLSQRRKRQLRLHRSRSHFSAARGKGFARALYTNLFRRIGAQSEVIVIADVIGSGNEAGSFNS